MVYYSHSVGFRLVINVDLAEWLRVDSGLKCVQCGGVEDQGLGRIAGNVGSSYSTGVSRMSKSSRSLSGKARGMLAVASVASGTVSGYLGNLLSGHWYLGTFLGLFVAAAFQGGAEYFMASREGNDRGGGGDGTPGVNFPGSGSYVALNYARDTFGDNANAGNFTIARSIKDRRKTVHHTHATNIKPGSPWLALAVVIAIAGGLYTAKQYGAIPALQAPTLQSAPTLAAEGGHGSPEAAVEGYMGNLLLGRSSVCGYRLPSEQSSCMPSIPGEATGSLAVGNPIMEGDRALVPVTGPICLYSDCTKLQGDGIPQGYTFDTAYAGSADPLSTGLFPCAEDAGKWYVDFSSI